MQAIWLDPLIIKIPRRDASGNEEIKQNKAVCVQSEDCEDKASKKACSEPFFTGFFCMNMENNIISGGNQQTIIL